MKGIRQVSVLALAAIVAACETPTAVGRATGPNRRPLASLNGDGTATFGVRGITYGPSTSRGNDGKATGFFTPNKCNWKGTDSNSWDEQYIIDLSWLGFIPITLPPITVSTVHTPINPHMGDVNDPNAGGIGCDPGGVEYNGGVIFVDAVIGGNDIALARTSGSIADQLLISTVSSSATITLRALPNAGCKFLYWTITPSAGDEYRDPSATIIRPGTTSDFGFLGEFQCGAMPTNPTPPPGDSKCLDPTLPGCDGSSSWSNDD